MSLAILRRTSGLVAMLCMAISLALAVQTTAQAFEMADHAGHHFAESTADVADDHDDGAREKSSDPADKPDHHHTDHHSIGLVADLAVVKYAPLRHQNAPPTPGMMRAGLAGYGIERPPKA